MKATAVSAGVSRVLRSERRAISSPRNSPKPKSGDRTASLNSRSSRKQPQDVSNPSPPKTSEHNLRGSRSTHRVGEAQLEPLSDVGKSHTLRAPPAATNADEDDACTVDSGVGKTPHVVVSKLSGDEAVDTAEAVKAKNGQTQRPSRNRSAIPSPQVSSDLTKAASPPGPLPITRQRGRPRLSSKGPMSSTKDQTGPAADDDSPPISDEEIRVVPFFRKRQTARKGYGSTAPALSQKQAALDSVPAQKQDVIPVAVVPQNLENSLDQSASVESSGAPSDQPPGNLLPPSSPRTTEVEKEVVVENENAFQQVPLSTGSVENTTRNHPHTRSTVSLKPEIPLLAEASASHKHENVPMPFRSPASGSSPASLQPVAGSSAAVSHIPEQNVRQRFSPRRAAPSYPRRTVENSRGKRMVAEAQKRMLELERKAARNDEEGPKEDRKVNLTLRVNGREGEWTVVSPTKPKADSEVVGGQKSPVKNDPDSNDAGRCPPIKLSFFPRKSSQWTVSGHSLESLNAEEAQPSTSKNARDVPEKDVPESDPYSFAEEDYTNDPTPVSPVLRRRGNQDIGTSSAEIPGDGMVAVGKRGKRSAVEPAPQAEEEDGRKTGQKRGKRKISAISSSNDGDATGGVEKDGAAPACAASEPIEDRVSAPRMKRGKLSVDDVSVPVEQSDEKTSEAIDAEASGQSIGSAGDAPSPRKRKGRRSMADCTASAERPAVEGATKTHEDETSLAKQAEENTTEVAELPKNEDVREAGDEVDLASHIKEEPTSSPRKRTRGRRVMDLPESPAVDGCATSTSGKRKGVRIITARAAKAIVKKIASPSKSEGQSVTNLSGSAEEVTKGEVSSVAADVHEAAPGSSMCQDDPLPAPDGKPARKRPRKTGIMLSYTKRRKRVFTWKKRDSRSSGKSGGSGDPAELGSSSPAPSLLSSVSSMSAALSSRNSGDVGGSPAVVASAPSAAFKRLQRVVRGNHARNKVVVKGSSVSVVNDSSEQGLVMEIPPGAVEEDKQTELFKSSRRMELRRFTVCTIQDILNQVVLTDEAVQMKKCRCNDDPVLSSVPGEARRCEAVDDVEGILCGCAEMSSGVLVRSGMRHAYRNFCSAHMRRLKQHLCCPFCGTFCTQGQFMVCEAKEGILHAFHEACAHFFFRGCSSSVLCPHCFSLPAKFRLRSWALVYDPIAASRHDRRIIVQLTPPVLPIRGGLPELDRKAARSIPDSLKQKVKHLPMPSEQDIAKLKRGAWRTDKRQPAAKYSHLYDACSTGNADLVIRLIRAGADVNKVFPDREGRTASHAAASFGYITVLAVLEAMRADLQRKDEELCTPLMLAAQEGHTDCVLFLLKNGCCPYLKGKEGKTALHFAAFAGKTETSQAILAAAKNPDGLINIQEDGGWTPLAWAAEIGNLELLKFFLAYGADHGIPDMEGNTTLHWGAISGNHLVVKTLLEAGAYPNAQNNAGDTALHIACRRDFVEVAVMLLHFGASLDIENKLGLNSRDTATLVANDSALHAVIGLSVVLGERAVNLRDGPIGPRVVQAFKRQNPDIMQSAVETCRDADVSDAKERHPVYWFNSLDEDDFPREKFTYMVNYLDMWRIRSTTGRPKRKCSCKGRCSSKCACAGEDCWYDKRGRLLPKHFKGTPMIVECGYPCNCDHRYCKNRVIQKGNPRPLQVFKTSDRGWGVRAMTDIPSRSFVCTLAGELLSVHETKERNKKGYVLRMPTDRVNETEVYVDSRKYGNVGRFINHSCKPNMKLFRAVSDIRFRKRPYIACFTLRDVKAGEELTLDYGPRYWAVSRFKCRCGEPTCRSVVEYEPGEAAEGDASVGYSALPAEPSS